MGGPYVENEGKRVPKRALKGYIEGRRPVKMPRGR